MQLDDRIRFDPVTPDHYDLLRRWLAMPHWREWRGDPGRELGFIIDMVEGRDGSHPFVFSLDDAPAGYIQYWHVGPHQREEWTKDNPWLMELPSDAVGVDISIGEAKDLSRGIGSTALRSFVRKLRDLGHRNIIIDPDPANERAVMAYRKADFVPVPHLSRRSNGVLIMRHKDNSSEFLQ